MVLDMDEQTKRRIEVLSSFEGGLQINFSRTGGVNVSTRYTPLVRVKDNSLPDAVRLCAEKCIQYADVMGEKYGGHTCEEINRLGRELSAIK